MTITIERDYELVVLELSGRLDTTTAPNLSKTIETLTEDTKNFVFDIKGLEYISSAGIRVLLRTYQAKKETGSMRIIGANEMIREVFDMAGLLELLSVSV